MNSIFKYSIFNFFSRHNCGAPAEGTRAHFGGWLAASWYALMWHHDAANEFLGATHYLAVYLRHQCSSSRHPQIGPWSHRVSSSSEVGSIWLDQSRSVVGSNPVLDSDFFFRVLLAFNIMLLKWRLGGGGGQWPRMASASWVSSAIGQRFVSIWGEKTEMSRVFVGPLISVGWQLTPARAGGLAPRRHRARALGGGFDHVAGPDRLHVVFFYLFLATDP